MKIVVLDAMGVIYSVGDDVKDLLCPFIEEKGGIKDISKIEELYLLAGLGNMSSSEFWKAVELHPILEDEYLQRHKLTDGLIDFLDVLNSQGYEIWCLSNDLSEWSKILRARFGLEAYFRGFVISGDVGSRKPNQAIYQHLIRQVDAKPGDMMFVDDGPRNLDTAKELGFNTILFAPLGHNVAEEKHLVAHTFEDILFLLNQA